MLSIFKYGYSGSFWSFGNSHFWSLFEEISQIDSTGEISNKFQLAIETSNISIESIEFKNTPSYTSLCDIKFSSFIFYCLKLNFI
jgi:hypothetical protein